jgi:hypothetical protein
MYVHNSNCENQNHTIPIFPIRKVKQLHYENNVKTFMANPYQNININK